MTPESVLVGQRNDATRLFEALSSHYSAGLGNLSDVIGANNKLLEAELALSSGPGARVSAHQEALKRAKDFESAAQKLFVAGKTLGKDVTEAKLHRTQIEVGLAGEQSKP
jgi:outer membrane protein TolC